MYEAARSARAAYETARTLSSQLAAMTGEGIAEFKAAVDALAPPPPAASPAGPGPGPGGGPGQGGAAGRQANVTLASASAAAVAAAMAMQAADLAPTARDVAACDEARRQLGDVMARFTTLTTTDLASLNAKRKAAGLPAVVLPKGRTER
jgi:hypothetical protein